MKIDELNTIKEIILNKIKELKGNTELVTDVDKDGDETDQTQGNFIIHMIYEKNDRNNALLISLREAYDKIIHGEYGTCEECDEEIPYKRLLICPEAKYCVKCAEILEKEAKNYRNGKISHTEE